MISSFRDLDFLVDSWAAGGPRPGKFLILFDSISECVQAGRYLRSRLPVEEKDFIKWHHSGMTSEFRSEELEALKRNEIIGFCATDTLGMVSNYYHYFIGILAEDILYLTIREWISRISCLLVNGVSIV